METRWRPIGDPSETNMPNQRSIGEQHAWSETHWRPACLIRNQHAWFETNMPYQRPIRDQHVLLETHWWPTCLIRDPLGTNTPDRRPIGDQHAWSKTNPGQNFYFLWVSDEACWSPMGLRWDMLAFDGLVSDQAYWAPMTHLGLWSGMSVSDQACQSLMGFRSDILVSDEACHSPMGLWSGMSVSDRSPIRHVGLWWVSNRSKIGLQ